MTITIITPVWNNVATVGHCMHSIGGQTVPCQHILVDGASTDGTLEVMKKFQGPNTLIISEPDKGMYDAINKGLKYAKGEIIGVLNADDYYPIPDVLQLVVDAFSDPKIEASYGDLLYVDRIDTDKVIRTWKSGSYKRERFYAGWMPPHPTFFVRRSLYEQYGHYRRDLGSAADYELMLRILLKHKARAIHIPEVLVHMRNEGMSNASLLNRLRANRYDRQAWQVNDVRPRPWTLIAKPMSKLGQWFR
ncbi:MAG: glycosyltransferase family 2 protein [Cyanobacteria bacterium P01_F01_bin.3]